MAPVKSKVVKKGPFSFLQRCCGSETTKAIEPSATRPVQVPVAAAPPPPPEPSTPPVPVPNLLTRTPLTTVEEDYSEADIIDVDTALSVPVVQPKERVTLSSVILVMGAIALATLLMNVD